MVRKGNTLLGTGRDFRKLFSARHFRQAAWSVTNLQNWPSAIAGGLWRMPVGQIRFRNGLRLKVDSRSEELTPLYEVFSDRVYDRDFEDIAPDGTILDIGGNIGTFTVRAARDLVPRGRVIVIEPNPKCLVGIEENLRLNRLGNVRILHAAVATSGEYVVLHISGSSGGGSTLFSAKNEKPRGTITAPALSGRNVLRLADAYELVKVDCEGGEFALLYETSPEDWAGTRRIAMEYHLGYDPNYAVSLPQLRERIEQLGFAVRSCLPTSDQSGHITAARA